MNPKLKNSLRTLKLIIDNFTHADNNKSLKVLEKCNI